MRIKPGILKGCRWCPKHCALKYAQVSNCGELSAKPMGIVLDGADANAAPETLRWLTWNPKTINGAKVFSNARVTFAGITDQTNKTFKLN